MSTEMLMDGLVEQVNQARQDLSSARQRLERAVRDLRESCPHSQVGECLDSCQDDLFIRICQECGQEECSTDKDERWFILGAQEGRAISQINRARLLQERSSWK